MSCSERVLETSQVNSASSTTVVITTDDLMFDHCTTKPPAPSAGVVAVMIGGTG